MGAVGQLHESHFLPLLETMMQLFDERIEKFVEADLKMDELQAYYKMQTRALNTRIVELKKIVCEQQEDLAEQRE